MQGRTLVSGRSAGTVRFRSTTVRIFKIRMVFLIAVFPQKFPTKTVSTKTVSTICFANHIGPNFSWGGYYYFPGIHGQFNLCWEILYKYSLTNIILSKVLFYYITEVLNLRPYYFTIETR
jgi:hypothetical protein